MATLALSAIGFELVQKLSVEEMTMAIPLA